MNAREHASLPQVSVIVPAHDSAAFLGDALDSVLAQSYPHWEAVVVDDASSDPTPDVAARYARDHPERIRVLRLKRNSGPAVARNTAIESSRGEVIALLDADDRWLPNYLEHMVTRYDQAVRTGQRVGIVACNALIETETGRPLGTYAEIWGWTDPVTYEGMIERSTIFVSALIPRAVFADVGRFSPECWGTEDYDLWLRILERGYEVVLTRTPLVIYRHRSAGLSRHQLRAADAGIVAYRRALDRATGLRARRAIYKRLRHYKALRARALVAEAFGRRRMLEALGLAVKAVPIGLAAALQDPGRWREWIRRLARTTRERLASAGSS